MLIHRNDVPIHRVDLSTSTDKRYFDTPKRYFDMYTETSDPTRYQKLTRTQTHAIMIELLLLVPPPPRESETNTVNNIEGPHPTHHRGPLTPPFSVCPVGLIHILAGSAGLNGFSCGTKAVGGCRAVSGQYIVLVFPWRQKVGSDRT